MNIGLIGWGIASGNGGMNMDIASLASWVTHWLVPEHPKAQNHTPYLERAKSKVEIVNCKLENDFEVYDYFLSQVDGILYIEHPCLKGDFDIVVEAKRRGKVVIGIPMWEWWPERKAWSFNTDFLWAVTPFTKKYLESLSDVLYAHGWKHNWRNQVIGSRWGVNLEDFPFVQRLQAKRFVFINGNGGYKLRKASDVVFDAFSRPGAPPLVVYTQQAEKIANNVPDSVHLINRNFDDRKDVYSEGDVFLFPSYWEGLCHGLYEGRASGGLIITTDHEPMNEAGVPYLIPLRDTVQEELSGKKIVKSIPCSDSLYSLCKSLYAEDISKESFTGRKFIEERHDLRAVMSEMYSQIVSLC